MFLFFLFEYFGFASNLSTQCVFAWFVGWFKQALEKQAFDKQAFNYVVWMVWRLVHWKYYKGMLNSIDLLGS